MFELNLWEDEIIRGMQPGTKKADPSGQPVIKIKISLV